MLVRRSGVALVALLLAGCGGGGSDDTAVSATPNAPPVSAAPGAGAAPSPSLTPGVNPAPGTNPAPNPGAVPAPAPTPVGSPAPVGGPAPAPVGGPAPAPVAGPTPAPVATVSGRAVLAALQAGVSADPTSNNPYSAYRTLKSSSGDYFLLGGKLESFVISGGFPGASGVGLWDIVSVKPVLNGGVIQAVNANGLSLEGAQLDLNNVNPALNATAGTWKSGNSFASLVIQEVPQRADLMRVCWNAHLPAPEAVTGPPGSTPLVRSAMFKRLMCGVYKRDAGATDVGGYLIDDIDGNVRTFSGNW